MLAPGIRFVYIATQGHVGIKLFITADIFFLICTR